MRQVMMHVAVDMRPSRVRASGWKIQRSGAVLYDVLGRAGYVQPLTFQQLFPFAARSKRHHDQDRNAKPIHDSHVAD